MNEKKKQEYTTGGLKNRQDVENALASAEYRPSQEVTDAASDLKQWQANRPGDYESVYQGRIDGLMEDLLDRKEFSYSYGADPLYRQYAQLYTQNAQNASADAAAQAAALTGGYGSSYAASAARQAYQQQIGALSEAIPTLYRLALDTYQSGGDALVEQIDQLNGQEQNAQQKYERELADYYTQLEQKGNAYNTAYTQDYGRYQDYLGQLDSLYGYYAAQEQQEAARRQQGFNNVMTVLGLLGDAAQLAITGTTGLGSMAGSLLNTGYNIYAGNRAYEAERADTAWKQKMQEQLRQDELAQQQYKNEQAQQEYQDKLRQQQVSNALAAERLDLSKSQWAAKQEKASRTAEKASADAAAKRGSLTGDTGLKVGKSGVSSGGTVPRPPASAPRNACSISRACTSITRARSRWIVPCSVCRLPQSISAEAAFLFPYNKTSPCRATAWGGFFCLSAMRKLCHRVIFWNRHARCRALRPHILPAQKQPCQKEHRPQPEDAAGGKQPVAASQSIRTFVGVHTQLHQGIGPQQPMTLGADKDAGNAAQQPQKNGYGKAADDHGQYQLCGNDSQRTQQSPQ